MIQDYTPIDRDAAHRACLKYLSFSGKDFETIFESVRACVVSHSSL